VVAPVFSTPAPNTFLVVSMVTVGPDGTVVGLGGPRNVSLKIVANLCQ
jgi:hypothetical protein